MPGLLLLAAIGAAVFVWGVFSLSTEEGRELRAHDLARKDREHKEGCVR